MPPVVYLLHAEWPYRDAAGHHPGAQHYIGVALDGDVERRVREHLSGVGSPLIRAMVAAGIPVRVVRTWPGGRLVERGKKNSHGPDLCPECRLRRRNARQLPLPWPEGASVKDAPLIAEYRLRCSGSLSTHVFLFASRAYRWRSIAERPGTAATETRLRRFVPMNVVEGRPSISP